MIDTHCHLDAPAFDGDREAVLARARAAGVTDVVVPSVEPGGWGRLVAFGASHPGVHVALGIHPQALHGLDPAGDDRHLADLESLLARGGAVAVGECGLDGPGAGEGAPLDRQRAVLRGHLAIARRLGLPVLLHSLRAHDAMLAELTRDGVPSEGSCTASRAAPSRSRPSRHWGSTSPSPGRSPTRGPASPSPPPGPSPQIGCLWRRMPPTRARTPSAEPGTSRPTWRWCSGPWRSPSVPHLSSSTGSPPGTRGVSSGCPRPDP